MTTKGLTRRQTLVATGAGVLAAGFGLRPALAETTVKQGYQTNMWGMPTYYLLHSGHLEKHGIKAEEFAVPSGNLTMQQQVARQVDLGTYAGPSFIIGHEKGGLIAIAKIEYVGKTARVMARKDLGLKTVADLRGKKVANQTGSSTGNIFVDQIATSPPLSCPRISDGPAYVPRSTWRATICCMVRLPEGTANSWNLIPCFSR